MDTRSSRRPARENVVFFESAASAEEAGFRPCRRCRPDESLTGFRWGVGRKAALLDMEKSTGPR